MGRPSAPRRSPRRQIQRLASAIFGGPRRSRERRIDRIVEAAIDKTVDGTDPRVRSAASYRKRLREPVEAAVRYVKETVEALPPLLEISRERYRADPEVAAFFASAKDLQQVVSKDAAVREFLAGSSVGDGEYLYLGMATTLTRKQVFVPALQGDVIRSEVPRETVSFGAHRFGAQGSSETALRRDVMERVFMALVECALARLAGAEDDRKSLEKERVMLRARLRDIRGQRLGLQPLAGAGSASLNAVELEARLAENEVALRSLLVDKNSLDGTLRQIAAVMGEPARHVRFEDGAVELTPMNFVATAEDREAGARVVYTTITSSTGENLACRLVRVPRVEILRQ